MVHPTKKTATNCTLMTVLKKMLSLRRLFPLDYQWELQFLIYQCVITSKSVKYHEKYHTRSRSPASKLYPTIGSELHTTNFIEPLVIAT